MNAIAIVAGIFLMGGCIIVDDVMFDSNFNGFVGILFSCGTALFIRGLI